MIIITCCFPHPAPSNSTSVSEHAFSQPERPFQKFERETLRDPGTLLSSRFPPSFPRLQAICEPRR